MNQTQNSMKSTNEKVEQRMSKMENRMSKMENRMSSIGRRIGLSKFELAKRFKLKSSIEIWFIHIAHLKNGVDFDFGKNVGFFCNLPTSPYYESGTYLLSTLHGIRITDSMRVNHPEFCSFDPSSYLSVIGSGNLLFVDQMTGSHIPLKVKNIYYSSKSLNPLVVPTEIKKKSYIFPSRDFCIISFDYESIEDSVVSTEKLNKSSDKINLTDIEGLEFMKKTRHKSMDIRLKKTRSPSRIRIGNMEFEPFELKSGGLTDFNLCDEEDLYSRIYVDELEVPFTASLSSRKKDAVGSFYLYDFFEGHNADGLSGIPLVSQQDGKVVAMNVAHLPPVTTSNKLSGKMKKALLSFAKEATRRYVRGIDDLVMNMRIQQQQHQKTEETEEQKVEQYGENEDEEEEEQRVEKYEEIKMEIFGVEEDDLLDHESIEAFKEQVEVKSLNLPYVDSLESLKLLSDTVGEKNCVVLNVYEAIKSIDRCMKFEKRCFMIIEDNKEEERIEEKDILFSV